MPESRFTNILRKWLLGQPSRSTPSRQLEISLPLPKQVYHKICLLILDPVLESEGGARMTQVLNWNDPSRLTAQLIEDLGYASYGYANYEIAERILVDEFIPLADGFRYTSADFMNRWRSQSGFHKPEEVDYHWLLRQYNITEKIHSGEIDEVWTVGYPYAGFYESRMAGPGAFWCNAPPLEGYSQVNRRFCVMAFNFERGVGEMLESYGHRAESILNYVFRDVPQQNNLWQQFTWTESTHPGQAEVGTIHFAPNSRQDYDWGNRTVILNHSRAWLKFPDLSDPPQRENAEAWGSGDIREHHLWWYRHLPHTSGSQHGIENNWWQYIVNPNLAG